MDCDMPAMGQVHSWPNKKATHPAEIVNQINDDNRHHPPTMTWTVLAREKGLYIKHKFDQTSWSRATSGRNNLKNPDN